MEGIPIDTIKRTDSVIDFRRIYPLPENLDAMDGFLIYHSKDHFFGSQWKDHPITIRSFVPREEQTTKSDPSPKEAISKSEPQVIMQTPASETVEEIPETKDEPAVISETKNIEAEEIVPSSEKNVSSLCEYIEALQLEKNAKEQMTPKQTSSFNWKKYPSLPIPPVYHLSPCIKIQLEDLSLIPDLPQELKTNGFLLLNYGNFGHLLLGWNPEKRCRYLGVPGIFDNEKRFISRLFGFQEFLTVPVQMHKTGNFGYFILPIQ